jgi:hypothetical protein
MFHPKATHQTKILSQMRSDGFQVPHYFGGSSVPSTLFLPHGSFSGTGVRNEKVFNPRQQKSMKHVNMY